MPRTSPFPIHLSSAEAVELRRRSAKYTLPYFQVQRAKIVLMAAEGLDNSEIAVRLGTRRDVVSEWRKRFFVERLAGLEERARPRRPRTFPPRAGRAGESLGLRTASTSPTAVVTLEHNGLGAAALPDRLGRFHQRQYALALVASGRYPPLVSP